MAVDLPAAVVEALLAWQAATLADRRGLRPVSGAALHVTLCFLGQCPSESVSAIADVLGSTAGTRAGGLALGQPVWLPRGHPRVLAVAVEDDDGELREMQMLLAARLARAGLLEPEGRIFFPHVTVARVRAGERVRAARLAAPDGVEFAGQAVTLYRSRAEPGGSVYEAIHRIELAGG